MCVPDPAIGALRPALPRSLRSRHRRSARLLELGGRHRRRADGRLHLAGRAGRNCAADDPTCGEQPCRGGVVHRRDGLPQRRRDPQLLGLRARLRAPGPHVRLRTALGACPRTSTRSRHGRPTARFRETRWLREQPGEARAAEGLRAPRGPAGQGPPAGAVLQLDGPHLPAAPPPRELALLRVPGRRARLRERQGDHLPVLSQSAGTPGIWNPLPHFATVKEDHQLHDIRPLHSFYRRSSATGFRRSAGSCPTTTSPSTRPG